MSRRIAIACATLAGVATTLVAAGPALARDDGARSMTVRHADLDLLTAAGQDKLNDRIRRVTRRVCSRPGDRSLDDLMAQGNCRREASSAARTRVIALTEAASARGQLASVEPR